MVSGDSIPVAKATDVWRLCLYATAPPSFMGPSQLTRPSQTLKSKPSPYLNPKPYPPAQLKDPMRALHLGQYNLPCTGPTTWSHIQLIGSKNTAPCSMLP